MKLFVFFILALTLAACGNDHPPQYAPPTPAPAVQSAPAVQQAPAPVIVQAAPARSGSGFMEMAGAAMLGNMAGNALSGALGGARQASQPAVIEHKTIINKTVVVKSDPPKLPVAPPSQALSPAKPAPVIAWQKPVPAPAAQPAAKPSASYASTKVSSGGAGGRK